MAEAKQLLLIRHGKASWQPQFKDFDRPLTSTGEAQSRCIADWLKQAALLPDCWLVSAARRTVQTADIVRLRLGQQDTVQNVSAGLYLAEADHLLATLQALPESADCTALVGHNPGLSELLIKLAGAQLSKFRVAPDIMWPATVAVLEFTGQWAALNRRQPSLKQVIHGKLLAKTAE
ncbi:MAG: histidine phosphatase family protein [Methylophaga sp.]|nr:histidine phosphatase family protein [Methylophaga sp.]